MPTSSNDAVRAIVQKISLDLTAFLASGVVTGSTGCSISASDVRGFVIRILPEVALTTTRRLLTEIDIDVSQPTCAAAAAGATCLRDLVLANCIPLTNLKTLDSAQAALFGCSVSAFGVQQESPCGTLSCAAVEETLLNAPQSSSGSKTGMIVGIIIGTLLVLALGFIVVRRFTYVRRSRRRIAETVTVRYTESFHPENKLTDDIVASAERLFGEELSQGRHDEETLLQVNQLPTYKRDRFASLFASKMSGAVEDGEVEGETLGAPLLEGDDRTAAHGDVTINEEEI